MWLQLITTFALFVWTAGSAITKDDCPRNIPNDHYLHVYGDKCYYFYLTRYYDYNPAQNYCKRRGGNLVMIKSEAINNFIQGRLRRTYSFSDKVWIGLNDEDVEGTFQWVDTSRLSYNNFARNEGTNHKSSFLSLTDRGAEDCIAIDPSSGGVWRDYRCYSSFVFYNARKTFICEFQAMPKPTTTSLPTSTKPRSTSTSAPVLETDSVTTTPDVQSTAISNKPSTSLLTSLSTDSIDRTSTPPDKTTSTSPPTSTQTSQIPPVQNKAETTGHTLSTSSKSPTISANKMMTTPTTKAMTPCPSIVCDLECGLSGFQVDPVTKCVICACDDK